MEANMWKNSLKNVEAANIKILNETLLDFLQRNGTYCLNKPRTFGCKKQIFESVHKKMIECLFSQGNCFGHHGAGCCLE